jgi:hypothetical protein
LYFSIGYGIYSFKKENDGTRVKRIKAEEDWNKSKGET